MSDLRNIMKIVFPYIREADFAVRSPWKVGPRRLLDYLIIYIQEGSCVIHVEGVEYHFQNGDFCLIQPNELHELVGLTKTITPYAHVDFVYNPNRENSFITGPGKINISEHQHLIQPKLNDFLEINIPVKFKPSQPIKFQSVFFQMISMWQQNDPISQLEAEILAKQLFLHLIKDHWKILRYNTKETQHLNWITSYFSFNLSEPLSINDMARRAQLSPSRFSAVFRKHFGIPPYQYLLNARIKHAQELLISSELSILEISDYCGFSSIHHFSTAFKKIVRVSPREYRNQ